MYEDVMGKILSEAASLVLNGKTFIFELSGQKLFPVVEQIGGYDKIVSCI